MKIGGLQKFTLSDYPGKTAAIIFTQGCNFRCPFCHNASLLEMGAETAVIAEEDIFSFLRSRVGKLDGVVISGGEPTLQPDLPGFCRAVKQMGFAVKLDSNGSKPWVLEKLLTDKLVDFIAMDIKAGFENYQLLSGVEVSVESIAKSINILSEASVPVLFRTTMVDGLHHRGERETISAMLPAHVPHVFQKFKSPRLL
jgi:pyruvate formate lyase activating enzyme